MTISVLGRGIAGGLMAGALIAVSGCKGSGSQSASGPPPDHRPSPTPTPTPSPSPSPQPPGPIVDNYKTAEYRRSRGLNRIQAAEGYAVRVTGTSGGRGVRVGVIDNGINASHRDLDVSASYKINPAGGVDGRHGTPVAGIIVARKNGFGTHGVAYEASLIDFNTQSPYGGSSNRDIATALRAAAGLDPSRPRARADVVNMSFGGPLPSSFLFNTMWDAANAGVLMAISTGNEGNDQPSYPARFASHPDLKGHAIAVGALITDDTSNTPRARFSNACGVAKNFCLFAPGTSVVTTSVSGGEQWFGGTSAAAPYVSGALAVTLGAFPTRTPAQIVQRILTTADDLGAPGIDAIYGRGALNLRAALSPVGALSLPTENGKTSGQTKLASIGSLRFSNLFGTQSVRRALKSVLVYDSQRFPFYADLSDGLTKSTQDQNVTNFVARSWSAQTAPSVRQNMFGFSSGLSFGFAQTGADSLGKAFDMQGLVSAADMPISFTTLVSPAEGLLDNRSGFGFAFDLARDLKVGVSVQSSSTPTFADDVSGFGFEEQGVTGQLDNKLFGKISLSYNASGTVFQLTTGLLNESESLLNTGGTGTLQLADSAQSSFVQLGTLVPVNQHLKLFASYTHGWSNTTAGGDSLWDNIANLRSDAFAVGATYNHLMVENDRFSFVVGQPLRVSSGKTSLSLPTGETSDGRVSVTRRSVDLAPDGRETVVQMGYTMPLTPETTLGFGAFARFQPDHDQDADTILGAGFKYRYQF